jgi:aryl-alcohol dehydrogenase-like predicted oxidoreductase
MESGLLGGALTPERIARLPHNDWRQRSPAFQRPTLDRAMRLVERLRAVGERRGRRPGEMAVAWTLGQPAVTAALVGARRPDQLDQLVGAASLQLTAQEIEHLEVPVGHALQGVP